MAGLLAAALTPFGVLAQAPAAAPGDTALLDMRDAFRLGRTAQLGQSLPKVQGHVLEPLARYWEMRARLESAPAADIRAALDAMAGTYWEDRLRNDWLLVLGRQRNWADFETERPRFRMNDDRQVRCYGLMLDAVAGRMEPTQAAARVQTEWLAQKDQDTGCATAAEALLQSGHLDVKAVWMRARLMMETGKTRAASQAVALLNPEWAARLDTIAAEPQRYLDGKLTAFRSGQDNHVISADSTTFVMTRAFSLANMRLVFANWMSSNIGIYALTLLGACIGLGIGTFLMLGRLGRRS